MASPEDQLVSGEALVHKAVSLVHTIAEGSDEDLAKAVPDPVYRAGFMKLVRELAPDGRRVEQVDIAGGRTRLSSTSLTVETRERVGRALQGVFEQAGWQQVRGKLVGIQVRRKTRLELTVEAATGPARKYEGPLRRIGVCQLQARVRQLFATAFHSQNPSVVVEYHGMCRSGRNADQKAVRK